jgi:hypothetical protein
VTFADFLHQATFWQWVGLILLASACSGIVQVVVNKVRNEK